MAAGKTEGLIKSFTAGGTIAIGTILKYGADSNTVVAAAAATDLIMGVALNAATSGEQVSVQMSGIAEVKSGGSITVGALVTSDASGNAVAGAATNRLLGYATDGAASGDLFPVMISIGMHT